MKFGVCRAIMGVNIATKYYEGPNKIIYLTNKLYTNYEIVLAIIPKQQDVYNIKEITCTHQDCQ